MKRLTLRTENQWRSLKDGAGVDLLRVSFHANAFQVAAAITIAGFGIGLTRWAKRWGEEYDPEQIGSVSMSIAGRSTCVGDGIPLRTYAWEPIETDGWAGVPEQGADSGREHG
jgi:hypothetical protein